MEKSIDSGFFPVVSLVEGNLFRMLDDPSMRGSILSLQSLLNGRQFSKSRRDKSDDNA